MILQTDTLFTCYKCDKSFSSSEELSQHQTSHSTEEKPFCCPYCQDSFFTFTEVGTQQVAYYSWKLIKMMVYCLCWLFNLSQLTKHRRHECIERRCPCRDCGALFPSPSRLRNHRIAVHPQRPIVAEDINTYQCCKCSKGFQTEEQLLEHQEKFASYVNCDEKQPAKKRGRKPKHAAQVEVVNSKKIKQEEETEECTSNEGQQELKIPCPEANCDLVFPSVASLRVHKKEKHGSTLPLQKAHACTECDESYARPDQLKAHIARAHHSEYASPTCGKSFAQESTLKVHQNTHSEGENVADKR